MKGLVEGRQLARWPLRGGKAPGYSLEGRQMSDGCAVDQLGLAAVMPLGWRMAFQERSKCLACCVMLPTAKAWPSSYSYLCAHVGWASGRGMSHCALVWIQQSAWKPGPDAHDRTLLLGGQGRLQQNPITVNPTSCE